LTFAVLIGDNKKSVKYDDEIIGLENYNFGGFG
jgi:hypothetical protein